MMKAFVFPALVFAGLFLAVLMPSCGGDGENTDNNIDTLAADTLIDTAAVSEVIYQIPSPDELFSLIRESGSKFRTDLMNSDKNLYNSRYSQEINLGIYVADLAYLAAYEKSQPSLVYFAKVKSMSDELGISNAISEAMYERIEKNMANADSLLDITNNSYYNVIEKLEETGNGKSLAVIMTGGWIESLYIVVNMVEKYKGDDPAIQRIASQKITFGNLINNLRVYKDDPDVANLITQLSSLESIFGQITKEVIGTNDAVKDTTKVIIGQKSRYIFPKDLFDSFKTEISNVRNQLIKLS